jgi:hypothetical protein
VSRLSEKYGNLSVSLRYGPPRSVTGLAPKAKLAMYKVILNDLGGKKFVYFAYGYRYNDETT